MGELGKKPQNFKAHQKIYLGGSIKWFFKCSKIDKLRNLGFSILRFLAQTPNLPILLFAMGSLALRKNGLEYYSSVAVQLNHFKILFALSFSF